MLKITKKLQKDFKEPNYMILVVNLLCKCIFYCYNLTLHKMKCIIHSWSIIVLNMIFLFEKPTFYVILSNYLVFFKKPLAWRPILAVFESDESMFTAKPFDPSVTFFCQPFSSVSQTKKKNEIKKFSRWKSFECHKVPATESSWANKDSGLNNILNLK